MLRVAPGELDLDRFELGVSDARRALRDDPARAATLLREAESLWQGRPLGDLEFEPFARLEARRLDELRLLAVEKRIEAELSLGRHALCPELESLVAEHPLRERPRAQLMLALYRSGRQADALETYRRGRARLIDELALEPSPALRELEQAILTQDTELDLPRGSPDLRPNATQPASPLTPRTLRPRPALNARAASVGHGPCSRPRWPPRSPCS